MLKCPIYDDSVNCEYQNCLFLRRGGCAIVLAATISEENQKAIGVIESKIDQLEATLYDIQNTLRNIK